jgi:hypothetical protein
MGRSCYCCEKCYTKIVVIAIYDESDPAYYPASDIYNLDLQEWNNLVDYHKPCAHDIIAGLMVPRLDLAIKPDDTPLPKDTDNDQWLVKRYALAQPRLSSDDIFDFFNSLINRADDENFVPELLVFVLDDSGSITISQYQEQLKIAKEQIQENYPNLIILDDISSFDERWLRDSRSAIDNRLCSCDGECLVCNCLNTNIPDEAKYKKFTKSKFILSGFEDWFYEGTYTGEFSNVGEIGSTSFPSPNNFSNGILIKGQASCTYKISAQGLSGLNKSFDFNISETGCFFVPEEQAKLVGEFSLETSLNINNISGKLYTYFKNLDYTDTSCITECSPTSPCPEFGTANYKHDCLHVADIPSSWEGKIGTKCYFDVYLIPYDYATSKSPLFCGMPNVSSCNITAPIDVIFVLKRTELIATGIYENYGHVLEETLYNQSPCQKDDSQIILKEWRSVLKDPLIYSYGLASDVYAKFFTSKSYCAGCVNGVQPPPGMSYSPIIQCRSFKNHINFAPLYPDDHAGGFLSANDFKFLYLPTLIERSSYFNYSSYQKIYPNMAYAPDINLGCNSAEYPSLFIKASLNISNNSCERVQPNIVCNESNICLKWNGANESLENNFYARLEGSTHLYPIYNFLIPDISNTTDWCAVFSGGQGGNGAGILRQNCSSFGGESLCYHGIFGCIFGGSCDRNNRPYVNGTVVSDSTELGNISNILLPVPKLFPTIPSPNGFLNMVSWVKTANINFLQSGKCKKFVPGVPFGQFIEVPCECISYNCDKTKPFVPNDVNWTPVQNNDYNIYRATMTNSSSLPLFVLPKPLNIKVNVKYE